MHYEPAGRRSERGVILVQVALMILVLVAGATFVVDYGILWVSRGQAQNAADAGALAGALARAYDDFATPPAADGRTAESALRSAEANLVWAEMPAVQVSFNCPPGMAGSCVRTDVYRNGQFGSAPLPVVFAPVLNITEQGVRATATARVAAGNATNCMRPFAVIDKWQEVEGTVGRFNRWKNQGNNLTELNPHDVYTPPSTGSSGTGYTVTADRGTELILKAGIQSENDQLASGWFLPIRLPDGNGGYMSGGDDFRESIATCIGNPVTIGQYLPMEMGVMGGPTRQGVEDLIALDADADWNGTTITGSCTPSCAPTSPRIVPLAVFDMDEYQWRSTANNWTSPWGGGPASPCPAGGKCVRVTNILGFFVHRMQGQDVVGYLMSLPGEFVQGAPALGGGAAFLTTIQLVQ
jgi:Putative Flp pilus-assembly TadE/G-like